MFEVNGKNIRLTRGDSFYCQITILQDGEEYELRNGDVVRFAMKKDYSNDTVIIEKTIPDSLILSLAPEETKQLPFNSKYVYDIELTKANGDVDTFISGTLSILPEVV